MPETSSPQGIPPPPKAIRRFDVFAEVDRLEALKDERPEDGANGHGMWLAKIVAGRCFGRAGPVRRRGEGPD